ncbi:hypothetical protein EB001_01805 [bacterium]|nr:hypothetical protein [bacterium]
MTVNIKLRRGLASEWFSINPTLDAGEPGFEIDTGKLKIGDGTSLWSALDYVVPSGLGGGGSSAWGDLTGIPANLSNIGSLTTASGDIIIASGNHVFYVSNLSESIDDRTAQLLVAGTGINLSYIDSGNTLTLNNRHTEINVLSQEPQGFVNRTDSVVSFNDSTRTFTIQPSGSSYDIYIEGIKVTKTATETVVIGSGTALNYLHFNTNTGLLDNKTTPFDFDTDVPIAYIHWNADINQSTFFGEERHGIRMDSSTHKWIHNTFGIQYINGLSIGNYVLLGNGSSNSHAQISISDGTLYQEDIIINIIDGSNGNPFTQELTPIAYIPTYYHSGTTGQWVRGSGTEFPVKYNGTRAQYNLLSGSTWTVPNVTNNNFFAMWIVATNDINDPILAIVGQRQDGSLNSAENNNIWSDLNLVNIPATEIKPLYRLIFRTNNSYTNTPKSSLQSILDLRESVSSTINGVTQNDHGLLFGLGDDDHSQYIHIDNARTISANHTFTNGLTISSGLLSATSGNFTSSLQLNGTNVSVSGHTHTSSDITNFNSAVSGLLPTIANSGDNRILTSIGSIVGINAETNATFDGTNFNISGVLNIDNISIDANTISSTNTNGNIVFAPNGTGDVQVDADTLRVGDSNADANITSNGTGNLLLSTNSNGTGGNIKIETGTNSNVNINAVGTGNIYLQTRNGVGANILVEGTATNSNVNIGSLGTGNINMVGGGNIIVEGSSGGNSNVNVNAIGTGNISLKTKSGSGANIIVEGTNTNSNVNIGSLGTGNIYAKANTVVVGTSSAAVTLTSNGAYNLTVCGNSTVGGNIVLEGGSTNSNVNINAVGTGNIYLKARSGSGANIIVEGTATNSNVNIGSLGTGNIYAKTSNLIIGGGSSQANIVSNGSYNLLLKSGSGTTGNIVIDTGGNVNVNPSNGSTTFITSNVQISANILVGGGSSANISTTNASAALYLTTNNCDITNSRIIITPNSNTDIVAYGNIQLYPDFNYGNVYINTNVSGNVGIAVKTATGIATGASAILNIVQISQADYNNIGSPDANTMYVIV